MHNNENVLYLEANHYQSNNTPKRNIRCKSKERLNFPLYNRLKFEMCFPTSASFTIFGTSASFKLKIQ